MEVGWKVLPLEKAKGQRSTKTIVGQRPWLKPRANQRREFPKKKQGNSRVQLRFEVMNSRKSVPSPPPASDEFKFDVFLSFRGEDTRKNFTDHLFAALQRKGISTFRDDKRLERGESIRAEIYKAIEESKSSIVIFSRNYASSTWCLDELVQILECRDKVGHQIFPVFYDVDPSEVRKQTGRFAEALAKHTRVLCWRKRSSTGKLQKWKSALTEVGNISGWDVKDRHESELIEDIVRKIAIKLKPVSSSTYPMELFEIDRCLETLSSVVASTFFLHSNCRCRGQTQTGSSSAGEGGSGEKQRRSLVLEKRVRQVTNGPDLEYLGKFSIKLLLEATDNFSDEFRIGRGSFGSVYRATLQHEEAYQVAIKRADSSSSHDQLVDEEFERELKVLSRLNHRNIVRLLGFQADGRERMLVYEYMDNGSLYDHLFHVHDSPLASWLARMKVALDAARGIEYLHEYAVPRIIHRDVKSSNILVNSNWTAKVLDFGLAQLAPDDNGQCSSFLVVAGTAGYLDPEYYWSGQLTSKSDVYGFGVILLELLLGRRVIHNDENGEPTHVVDFVAPFISEGEINMILDPRVEPPNPSEIAALISIGDLASQCVSLHSRDRPSMTEVVNCLTRALNAIVAVYEL